MKTTTRKLVLFILLTLFVGTNLHAGSISTCIEDRVYPIEKKIDYFRERVIELRNIHRGLKYRRKRIGIVNRIRIMEKLLQDLHIERVRGIDSCIENKK